MPNKSTALDRLPLRRREILTAGARLSAGPYRSEPRYRLRRVSVGGIAAPGVPEPDKIILAGGILDDRLSLDGVSGRRVVRLHHDAAILDDVDLGDLVAGLIGVRIAH